MFHLVLSTMIVLNLQTQAPLKSNPNSTLPFPANICQHITAGLCRKFNLRYWFGSQESKGRGKLEERTIACAAWHTG